MHSKFQDSPNVNWFSFPRKKEDEPNFPNVIKTFMGRDALNIYLWNIKQKRETLTALIPAYICKEVPDQFKRNSIDIKYYDLKNFQITVNDIKSSLDKSIDIFYFVHYFGIYQKNIKEIIKTVKNINPNAIIIEDRAHYLSDKYILPEVDAVIYSFRKLLPIPEGGGIYSKQKLTYQKKPRLYSNFLVSLVLLKKKIFGHNPKFSRSNVMKDTLKPSNELLLPSSFSEKVINQYNIEEEIQFRRKLFYLWKENIEELGIKPVFKELSEKDIPQGFPIYVDNAQHFFENMLKKGIFLKRHWELPKYIEKVAPFSYNLSNKIITLPIYKGIENRNVIFLKNLLK
ncbi:MAG: hypothetical protein GXO22_00200 [Aquificae bacterium]|nr:hypothetical protein [Aquificota bacterium]